MFDARLATIRKKLDELRGKDVAHRVHGAYGERHGHQYRELPVLDKAKLAEIEQSYAVTLPAELRAFLSTVHGGGPGPGYGFYLGRFDSPAPKASQPFLYGTNDALATIEKRRTVERYATLPFSPEDDDNDDYPPGGGFLTLSHEGCGCFDVLVVTGEQRGRMWFCDGGWVPEFSERGPWSFLDWYEEWLDRHLDPGFWERLAKR